MGLVSVSFLLVGLVLCLLSLLPMLLSNIRAHLGIWLPLALGIAMVLFGRFYRVVFQQASDAVGWAGFGLLCIFVLWLAVSLLVLALGYPRFTQKDPPAPWWCRGVRCWGCVPPKCCSGGWRRPARCWKKIRITPASSPADKVGGRTAPKPRP